MIAGERTSRQWFAEAVRCYEQYHQACPWCGASHCVYRSLKGTKQIFSCQTCDFEVVHDEATDVYRHIAGEAISEQPDTMFAL